MMKKLQTGAVFISIFLNVNIVMGWILRLPCKTEANFSVSAVGHALEHNVLLKLTLPLEECKVNCLFTHHCKSFNHKQSGDDNCELNSETDVTKPGTLVARSGWTYYATDQTGRAIGSFCRTSNPCSDWQYCIDDCSCLGRRCLQCSEAYHASYGWYCLNAERKITIETRLPINNPVFSSGMAAQLNDNIRTTSEATCPKTILQLNPWFSGVLGSNAEIYAVAIQGFNRMIGQSLDVTFKFFVVGSDPQFFTCFSGQGLTKANEYKIFLCPEGTKGDHFWISSKGNNLLLEACEVEVYGKMLP